MSFPAKVNGRALVLAGLNVRADPVELELGRCRPDKCIGIERLRDFESLDGPREALKELVVYGFLHKDARSGGTGLSGVKVDTERRPRDCLVQVGVATVR